MPPLSPGYPPALPPLIWQCQLTATTHWTELITMTMTMLMIIIFSWQCRRWVLTILYLRVPLALHTMAFHSLQSQIIKMIIMMLKAMHNIWVWPDFLHPSTLNLTNIYSSSHTVIMRLASCKCCYLHWWWWVWGWWWRWGLCLQLWWWSCWCWQWWWWWWQWWGWW